MSRTKTFDEDRAVDAAVDCFWARGYEATSVRDLAEAMGIGGASLYNAYGDKRELFALALERYANRSMRERIARIETRYPPKEAIGAFLAEIIDRSAKDPDCKGCLLVNSALDVASRDAELGKAVAAYLGEIRAFFRRSLEGGRRTGDIAPSLDVEVISGHLLGIVLAIRVLARTGAKRRALESVAQPALDLLRTPARPSPRRKPS
jgi:TetR/AcrR family transcriptional regulator, transcriptional repressor for nem operon